MAGKRRRILVTPSDEVWKLIDEVHGLSGQPRAAIVAEILDAVAPAFLTQIQALRMLADQPREAQRLINNFASESLMQLAQTQLELDAAIDARTVKGKRAAKQPAKKGARRGRTS